MKHRVIDGRIYRVVQVEAADTTEAAQHPLTRRPLGAKTASEIRKVARS